MDSLLTSFILLPVGLGLLGFIEPCTIGGHLLFLGTLENRGAAERTTSVLFFTAARTLAAGLFGVFAAILGQAFVGAQKGFWLIFGLAYLVLGLAYLLGKAGLFKRHIRLAPASWEGARNPAVIGLVLGLNIPACAAPILFALIGMAASTGTLLTGFATMALFGLALSLPLALVVAVPIFSSMLRALGGQAPRLRWLLGVTFVILGFWSIWFGLFVDPADWAGT